MGKFNYITWLSLTRILTKLMMFLLLLVAVVVVGLRECNGRVLWEVNGSVTLVPRQPFIIQCQLRHSQDTVSHLF